MDTPQLHTPFNFRPVCATSELRGTHRTAYASYSYIRREPDVDRYGPMPSEWATRGDLIATGREHPAQTPGWARSGPRIWKDADASVTPQRHLEPAAFHIVLGLPPEQDVSDWTYLIERFCSDTMTCHGMIVDWAIHHKPGLVPPHAHLLVTARGWRPDRSPGRRHARWFTSLGAIRSAELAWIDISGLRPALGFEQTASGRARKEVFTQAA